MNKLSNKRINFIVINCYKNEQNNLLNLDTKANFHFCFCFLLFFFFHKFYPMTFKEKPLLVTFFVLDFLSIAGIFIYLSVTKVLILSLLIARKTSRIVY